MKRYYLIVVTIICILQNCYTQNYNQEKIVLTNFLVRMYKNAPFEGVKIVSDYNNDYLLSVVLVKKTTNSSEGSMNRVAQVKSSRQVSQYLNNGMICSQSETIVRTTEEVKERKTVEEIIDIIKENSIGFVKGMEILTTFDINQAKERCFMFYRKVEEMRD